jgi:hypothetical protein
VSLGATVDAFGAFFDDYFFIRGGGRLRVDGCFIRWILGNLCHLFYFIGIVIIMEKLTQHMSKSEVYYWIK